MSNRDAPQGGHPVRHLAGGNAFTMNEYSVDSSNATAIFVGDAMILEADGNVAPYTTGGGSLIGFCAGVKDDFDDLQRRYLPASTAGTVLIYDDPYVTFGIQTDGTITADDAGNNADLVAGSGSTTTSISAHEVSGTTGTSTAQLRLIRPVPRDDNDVTAANSEWEVVINEHMFKTTTGI